jgi:hypothetical protein
MIYGGKQGEPMKNLIVSAAILFTAITSFAGEKMEIVTVSTGEVVQFQIALEYTADSCNSVSVYGETLSLVSKNYKGGKLYEPEIQTMQTVVGCADNKTTQETIVSEKVYTTKAGTTVRVMLPKGYSVVVK